MKKRAALFNSVIALILCVAMLAGSTFAWFTDSSVSTGNIIKSGKLDLEVYWAEDLNGTWNDVENVGTNKIFDYQYWEPGYTQVRYIKIVNAGDLAFRYALEIKPNGEVSKLADVIDVYAAETIDGRADLTNPVGTLREAITGDITAKGELTEGEVVLAIALKMREDAGNEYQNLSIGDSFGITINATQYTYEEDSFGDDYDTDAALPGLKGDATGSTDVETENGVTTAETTITTNTDVKATVPAGVKVEDGKLSLSVTAKDGSDSNITAGEGENLAALDVHIEGVAPDNTTPIIVELGAILAEGFNQGNMALYHVENGTPVAMTQVLSLSELDAHNEYYYNPATGIVTVAMATFSEVALVATEEAKWEGKFDYTWYKADATEFVIANADQLAAFGAIVGGMKKVTDRVDNKYTYDDKVIQDSFKGKTVKLISDINLGDDEEKNNPNLIFYPIGYYNSEGTYERTNTAITSGLRNFEGTFDGNGHTVSNFYHNTWEMKGDHDWYSPEEQYYRDGMGLFGRVYKGTVKNLTVRNFKSDGEIATTGVIAAYADGATFENIAIFNCNPRVYNIGNGGIVGCVGWYAKEANLKTTFKNITVDNSNKISALWGSYDVACGGIVGQYYPTSGQSSANYPVNAGIDFVNCHVSAQMDVYNDVCANYQYYAYRYTGMLIGSVRENETIDGHVYPKMDGITASGCTVHFGTWNDYYYCEIIDNTTASYTHDYQMSRLTEIKAIDGTTITNLDGTTGTVPASGRANYVIVDYTKGHGTENATCYHFKDGAVWTHDMGGIQTGIDENGDGQDDLKEDKQHIYLEFNNLVTGYGWGVTTKVVGQMDGVTILDREVGNSVEKFESSVKELANNKEYKLGDIFTFVDKGVELVPGALAVAVTNVNENNPVSATIVYDRDNWENGTITFTGNGEIKITIQDYYFCTPTTITVNVTEREDEEKFDVVMNNGDFLHRVGNSGTVALDKLFKAKDGVTVGTVSVTIDTVYGASGTYSNNAIQFSGTGVVKVTITDDDYCIPTELYLEVVDATNVTGLSGTISGNVVLLNNCGLSSLTVSGRNTVYGNGFTATYTGNGQYLNNGLKQGIVTVSENGTLDNLRIKASIYPFAFMYYGTTVMGDYVQMPTNPKEVEGEKTRYYYQLSAVVAKGNATIQNCYIYGGRTNVFVDTGDVTIKDSVLECAPVANVQIQSTSGYTVTFENVTTIQYQVNATVGDASKVMLGTGVLVGPDTETNPTIVLNNDFKQYNWVTAEDQEAVSDPIAQKIINGALKETAYNHTINGKPSSNLGIIYMNEARASVENNTNLPYKLGTVSISGENGQVYSVQNASANQIYSDCANADRSTVNGDYLPTFVFNLGEQEISYEGAEDTRYLYGDANGVTALYQDGDSALTLDLTKLATIYKYTGIGYDVTAVCKDSSGNALTNSNGVVDLEEQGKYTLVFTVEDNIFYEKNGQAKTKSVTRSFEVPLSLTVKEANIKNAAVNITKTALDGVYNTVNLTDYELRINFLDCISVTDYDNKGTKTTVNLSSNISSATLTPSGANVFTTAFEVTITYTDGRVLTVNFSNISGSSPGTKTGKVNTSGSVYFTTEGALNNKPTEASSQNKCTITSVSFKGNSGSTVTNDTDVTVTWALGSSGGGTSPCVTSDTLVTLADGTQKRIDQVTHDDKLLVWDFYKGEYAAVPAAIIFDHGYDDNTVIALTFSDGTVVKVVNMHQFFDADLNALVTINEDSVVNYVGHKFVKQAGDSYTTVTLVDYTVTHEYVEAWGIMSALHYNIIVEGMFSADFDPADFDLFNYFEVGENMMFDEAKMQADIEKYGLYTYEDFADYLTYEQFVAFNVQYFKIAVGKGLYTYEGILDLIATYLR